MPSAATSRSTPRSNWASSRPSGSGDNASVTAWATSGEPTLVHPEKDRRTVLDLLLGDVSQYLPDTEKMLEQHVRFYYLWK